MQHGFPLRETSRRHGDFRVFAQIDSLPRAPVAVGIVDIPATREEFDVACAAKFSSTPARKDASIKNVAFVTSLCFRGGSQQKDLSQVACRSIDSTVPGIGKRSYLGGAGLEQVDVVIFSNDRENVAAIACADQQPPTFVKRQRVYQIIAGCPETAGRAVGGNAVDFRASGRSACWKRAERRLRIGNWRSARNCNPRLRLWRRHRCGRRVRSRNREARSRAAAALLASGRSIDIARLVDCQRCNFFLGGAVENKSLSFWRDAVHQTTAIRTGDQISTRIECEHPDVSFVTLEKDRSIPRRCDPENLTAIPGGDVKIAGCV